MIVTVDNKYKVLSNGTLLGITKDNKRRKHTYHWKQSKQHSTYLINLSIADYAIIEDSLGSLPINYWVYPEHVEKFEFKLDAEPLMVRFDDGNHLLKEWTENKTEEELLFQVENDDAPGRLWAIDQLKSFHSSPKMIQKWTELAMTDPFWAVREAAAQTISEFHGSSSKAIFLQTIGDSNSKVRAASIKALGEINEPSMVGNFRNIYETDDSYLVMAEALIAIGKNGNKSHLGFLDQAAKVRSPRNTLKNAAEQAIEMIRNPQ
jgi:aminopeptidase N